MTTRDDHARVTTMAARDVVTRMTARALSRTFTDEHASSRTNGGDHARVTRMTARASGRTATDEHASSRTTGDDHAPFGSDAARTRLRNALVEHFHSMGTASDLGYFRWTANPPDHRQSAKLLVGDPIALAVRRLCIS